MVKIGFALRRELAQRAVAIDHRAVDRRLQLVGREALVALDGRQHLVLLHLVAQPLAHAADDAGKARRDLHQGFLVGLDRAVEGEDVAQFPRPRDQQLDPAAATWASVSFTPSS